MKMNIKISHNLGTIISVMCILNLEKLFALSPNGNANSKLSISKNNAIFEKTNDHQNSDAQLGLLRSLQIADFGRKRMLV